jgi:hypothetical protein
LWNLPKIFRQKNMVMGSVEPKAKNDWAGESQQQFIQNRNQKHYLWRLPLQCLPKCWKAFDILFSLLPNITVTLNSSHKHPRTCVCSFWCTIPLGAV